MNIEDKEKNEYLKKHNLFIEKYESNNLYLCSYNLPVYESLIKFLRSSENTLLVHGNEGIGKTHLINFLIKNEPRNSIYIDTSGFIETIYDLLKLNKSTQDLTDWILEHKLIVFDCFHLTKDKEKINRFFRGLVKQLNDQKVIFIWTRSGNDEQIPDNYRSIYFPDPDKETLKSISVQFIDSHNQNLKLTNQALNWLIESIPANIKTLMDKLLEFLLIQDNPGSPSLIKEEKIKKVLNNIIKNKNNNSEKTIEDLIQKICEKLKFNREEIFSKSRKKDIVCKRNIVIYLLKKMSSLSHKEIGDYFGKNHSTITHSIKQVEERMNDKYFREYLKIFL